MAKEMIKCSICGAGPFKDHRGLNGHRAIVHGVDKRTVEETEIVLTLRELSAKIDKLILLQEEERRKSNGK